MFFIWIVLFLSVVSDQLSKFFAKNMDNEIILIDNFFKIKLLENSGIAFGIPFSGWIQKIFSLILLIVAIYFIVYHVDKKSVIVQITIGLFLGGAIGNLIDRFFRDGKVIDFISFGFFPSFNIADICLSISVIIFFIFNKKFVKIE